MGQGGFLYTELTSCLSRISPVAQLLSQTTFPCSLHAKLTLLLQSLRLCLQRQKILHWSLLELNIWMAHAFLLWHVSPLQRGKETREGNVSSHLVFKPLQWHASGNGGYIKYSYTTQNGTSCFHFFSVNPEWKFLQFCFEGNLSNCFIP